jgi:hypothetical protein
MEPPPQSAVVTLPTAPGRITSPPYEPRWPAGERHGTAGHRGTGLAIRRGHSSGRARKRHVAAARAAIGRLGSVTAPPAPAEPPSNPPQSPGRAGKRHVTAGQPESVTAPPATAEPAS